MKVEALASLRHKCEEAAAGKKARTFVRMDDQFLLAFLRAKRFDVAKAFACVVKYTELAAEVGVEDYVVRRDGGISHGEMGRLYAMDLLQLLPGAARDGSRIAIVRGALFDEEMLATLAMTPDGDRAGDRPLRFLLWLFTRLVSDPYVQVHGLTMVEDLGGMELMGGVRFARSLDKGPKRRLLRLVQSAMPIRFVAFYMIDAPTHLGMVLALARPFLTKKMRQRIVLASDLLAKGTAASGGQSRQAEMEVVASLVGHQNLPPDLGGTLAQADLSPSWWEWQCGDGAQTRAASDRSRAISLAAELGIPLEASKS